ncbi:hypothetical protein M8C21_019935, partial [Ambrosia artemisiifolia]
TKIIIQFRKFLNRMHLLLHAATLEIKRFIERGTMEFFLRRRKASVSRLKIAFEYINSLAFRLYGAFAGNDSCLQLCFFQIKSF